MCKKIIYFDPVIAESWNELKEVVNYRIKHYNFQPLGPIIIKYSEEGTCFYQTMVEYASDEEGGAD